MGMGITSYEFFWKSPVLQRDVWLAGKCVMAHEHPVPLVLGNLNTQRRLLRMGRASPLVLESWPSFQPTSDATLKTDPRSSGSPGLFLQEGSLLVPFSLFFCKDLPDLCGVPLGQLTLGCPEVA